MPVAQAFRILFGKEAIEQPNWMAVKSTNPFIHQVGITLMELPLLVHEPPELLQTGQTIVTAEHIGKIGLLQPREAYESRSGKQLIELNHAGLQRGLVLTKGDQYHCSRKRSNDLGDLRLAST